MSDIVERLRSTEFASATDGLRSPVIWVKGTVAREAADEIEKLRAAVQDLAKHIWRGDWDKLKPETRELLGEKEMSDIADKIYAATGLTLGAEEAAKIGQMIQAENEKLRDALKNLLSYAERNECHHENTHRGGIIWTICDDCGGKWADDQGGLKPYCESVEITAARQALGDNGNVARAALGEKDDAKV
jgi:hypothetical protein